MRGNSANFLCRKCGQIGIRYCRDMCNPCYQRHLRQKHKNREKMLTVKSPQKEPRNDYPFQSSRIGEGYQAFIPSLTKEPLEVKYTKIYKPNPEAAEYLKFCKLVFCESPLEGDIIKGGAEWEPNALKLLEKYGSSLKAKYHILNPTKVLLHPSILETTSEQDMKREIEEYTREIMKYKEETKDEFVERLVRSLESGISEQELQNMLQTANNMRISVPLIVTERLSEAQEFSHRIKKRLTEREITISELENLVENSKNITVRSALVDSLQDLLVKAKEWELKVNQLNYPTLKQLNTLVTEGTCLSLDLPDLPKLREKFKNVKKWIEKVHKMMKKNKFKKEPEKISVVEIKMLLEEARSLEFSHHEMENMQRGLEQVNEWQERIKMRMADEKETVPLIKLIEKGNKLPYAVENLKVRMDEVEWRHKADNLLNREKIPLKTLTALCNEAKAKDITCGLLFKLEKIGQEAKQWKADLKKMSTISEPIDINHLEELYNRGTSLPVDVNNQLQKIKNKLTKGIELRKRSQEILKQPSKDWDLEEMSAICKEQESSSVVCEELKVIETKIKQLKAWIEEADYFLSYIEFNDPSRNDFNKMQDLLKEAPILVKQKDQYKQLEKLENDSIIWSRNCLQTIKTDNLDRLQELFDETKLFPVDPKLYRELLEKLRILSWEYRVKKALSCPNDISKLIQLESEVTSADQRRSAIHKELVSSIRQTQEWKKELTQAMNNVSLDELIELYRRAKEYKISITEKYLLKEYILELVAWKHKAGEFIARPGMYQELDTLLHEIEVLDCEFTETEILSDMWDVSKEWRKKAKQVINALPNFYGFRSLNPQIFKKTLVEIEYELEKGKNIENDLISAVENAREIVAPLHSPAFPCIHPTEGFYIIINPKYIYPKTKPVKNTEIKRRSRQNFKTRDFDDKATRPMKKTTCITKFKEDDIRYQFCICRKEASVDDVMMLACDVCGEWYHPTCIGISSNEVERLENSYVCFVCCERLSKRYDLAPPSRKILNRNQFQDLISEGARLPVKLQEYEELENLKARIEVWEESVGKILNKKLSVLEHFEEVIERKENYEEISAIIVQEEYLIHKLMLEFEGFPVELEIRNDLTKIMKKRDWIMEAANCIYKKTSTRHMKKLLKDVDALNDTDLSFIIDKLKDLYKDSSQYNTRIQDLLYGNASYNELKEILATPQVKELKTEKIEKLRKKMRSFENIISDISKELDTKTTFDKLLILNDRLKKFPFNHPSVISLRDRIYLIQTWYDHTTEALKSENEAQVLESLYQEYLGLKISHPLGDYLESQMKRYCICKQFNDGRSPMIECDECKEWFHSICVNIPAEVVQNDQLTGYICPSCSEKKAKS